MASWAVACVLIGWLVVYNLMRIEGDSPSQAAIPSFGIGAAAGIVVFAAGLLALRRLHASGRRLRTPPAEIPAADAMDAAQRDAVRLTWPPLAVLAAAALLLGLVLAGRWLAADAANRGWGTALLAAWDVLVGLWLGDEAIRLRRGEADGIESIQLGCTLTAVLAGVGISRNLAQPGQVALIVLAGIAGALAGLAVWRFHGARGVPAAAVGVVVVAALSLVLPLVI